MCLGLQARHAHGCEVCSYLLKQTDAPTVVEKRYAAPLISQRGRYTFRKEIGGELLDLRFFVKEKVRGC